MAKVPKEENSKIAVTLPKTALEQLKEQADSKGIGVSTLIRLIVLEHLKEN